MPRLLATLLLVLLLTPIPGPAAAQNETLELQAKLDAVSAAIAAMTDAMAALQDRVAVLEAAPAAAFVMPTAATIDYAPEVAVRVIACATATNTAVECDILALTQAYDVNGDSMSASAECPNGSHDGTTYTPDTDFTGPDACVYRITDGSNLTPEGQLNVTVAAP